MNLSPRNPKHKQPHLPALAPLALAALALALGAAYLEQFDLEIKMSARKDQNFMAPEREKKAKAENRNPVRNILAPSELDEMTVGDKPIKDYK
uniref:Uncharacterized protein n=1 Tax=Arundo donax TaxID=35708 RepID=A0A0A9SB57_ARUDO